MHFAVENDLQDSWKQQHFTLLYKPQFETEIKREQATKSQSGLLGWRLAQSGLAASKSSPT
jgi:hypothetical protein